MLLCRCQNPEFLYNNCIVFLTGYAIFVVTGTLPRCEANDVLTLVRAEPPPAPSTTAHSSSARYPSHGGHSPQGSRGEVACSGHKRQSKGGTEMLCKHHRSSDKEEERKQLEEQELQMAMAMSVSLQQNQERYEVERQMQIRYRHQQHQEGTMEEEEEDPAFCGDNEATGYEEEEDEAALTAAIYASLGIHQLYVLPGFHTGGALGSPPPSMNSPPKNFEKLCHNFLK